jgi:hypothetical protein
VRPSAEQVWERLRLLDDPDAVERPANFDEAETSRRFSELVQTLESIFSCECVVDAGFPMVQDASHFGTARVPATATDSGVDIIVRVSNFGDLAVFAAENLGCWSESEPDELLTDRDRARVEEALAQAGYFVVPEDILERPYDGVNDYWRTYFPNEPGPTWATRFFDWV